MQDDLGIQGLFGIQVLVLEKNRIIITLLITFIYIGQYVIIE